MKRTSPRDRGKTSSTPARRFRTEANFGTDNSGRAIYLRLPLLLRLTSGVPQVHHILLNENNACGLKCILKCGAASSETPLPCRFAVSDAFHVGNDNPARCANSV